MWLITKDLLIKVLSCEKHFLMPWECCKFTTQTDNMKIVSLGIVGINGIDGTSGTGTDE